MALSVWLFLFLAVAAGVGAPVQAGVNAHLARWTSPIHASLVSFAVGGLALLLCSLVTRLPWPPASLLGQAPRWAWTGGPSAPCS